MRRLALIPIACITLVTSIPIVGHCQQVDPARPFSITGTGVRSESVLPALRTLAIGTVLTLALHPQDARVQREAVESPVLDMGGADLGDIYGNGIHLALATAGTWGIGLITDNSYTKETAGLLAKSLLLETSIVWSAKHAFGRTRPDGSDRLSFPSGHTAGAFTFSTVMARRYGWKVGVLGYTLATMTAGARMEDNRHFLSDVVAGATVGIAVGQFMTRGKAHTSRKPYLYANGAGLGVGLSF